MAKASLLDSSTGGWTAFHEAAHSHKPSVLALLLELAASSAPPSRSLASVHSASPTTAAGRREEVGNTASSPAPFQLGGGTLTPAALLTLADEGGNTPLHAVFTGDVGGSDSDSEEEGEGDGEAYGNNPDARGLNRVVDILLSNGANPKATNSEMKTALDLAKAKGLRRPYRTMKRHLKSTKRKK